MPTVARCSAVPTMPGMLLVDLTMLMSAWDACTQAAVALPKEQQQLSLTTVVNGMSVKTVTGTHEGYTGFD